MSPAGFLRAPPPGRFTVVAGDATSHPFAIDGGLYAGLPPMPSDSSTSSAPAARSTRPGRQATADPPATWEFHRTPATPPCRPEPAPTPSAHPDWSESGRFDVSGGWYDAGDHGKYVTSGALPAWQRWPPVDLLRDHPSTAPAGLEAALLEEAGRAGLAAADAGPTRPPYADLAFHRVHGTSWAPAAMWPHEDPVTRVLHRPSTGAGLHLAAVAARAAQTYADVDPAYADRLLTAARRAYAAAHDHPALIAPDDQGAFGGGPYGDDDLTDDFFWAAELQAAPAAPAGDPFPLDGFDFDAVAGPAHLSLGTADLVQTAARRVLVLQQDQPWGQPYAPDGPWGWESNGRILNNLMLGSAYELTGEADLLTAT